MQGNVSLAPPGVNDGMASGRSRQPGSLLEYFLLAFALTWTCFIAVAVAIPARSPLGSALLILGAYMPAVAATWCTWRSTGVEGVRELWSRAIQTAVATRWFVFAAVYMAAIKLSVALLHRLLYGGWPRFGGEPWFLLPFAVAFSTPFQAGEEIGWRGYALPRLASRMGPALASLLLGLLWAVWHLPAFFIRDADKFGQSFWVYLLQVTALSVAMAWLVGHSRGSVLTAMLFHAAVNNTKDIVPSVSAQSTHTFGLEASRVAWLTLVLLWACAAYFLARMPRTAWWRTREAGE